MYGDHDTKDEIENEIQKYTEFLVFHRSLGADYLMIEKRKNDENPRGTISREGIAGIFFSREGQCAEISTIEMIINKEEREGGTEWHFRPVVVIKVRPNGKSALFKNPDIDGTPNLSLLDFAYIPLKKPKRQNSGGKKKKRRL